MCIISSKGIATAITKTSAPLTEGRSSGGADWQGKDPNDRTDFNFYNTDGGLIKTAGLQLIEGRDIDVRNYPTDSTTVVLNEAAVKVMGFKNPIGKVIDHGQWDADWHVIGVVKDFILQSPYDPIKPIIIQGPKATWFNEMHIKFNQAHSTAQSIAAMQRFLNNTIRNIPSIIILLMKICHKV